jgi:glycosyltransferase involved in cell wall biosynthesis
LQTRKRIDNLIRVCLNLPTAIQPNVWIVGDGPARAEFEQFARDNYPKARFFGSVHGQRLASIFNEAHLFVLPGTGGLAAQEAMAYGLPVIIAKGDGTQDDLVRPENGWQVSPDDHTGLQEALSEALSDPERLSKMGRESYRIVSQEINVERMVAVFVEALNSTRFV